MRILFFSHLQDVAGRKDWEFSVSAPMAGDQLWAKLLREIPALAGYRQNVRLARNWEYADAETLFGDADEVALIPPVSGG